MVLIKLARITQVSTLADLTCSIICCVGLKPHICFHRIMNTSIPMLLFVTLELSFRTSLLSDIRLSNFTIMVGHDFDWQNNQHCYSQLPPVPMGATVLYPCDRPLQGHVVSVNKTSATEANLRFLVIFEVGVYGFENGENLNRSFDTVSESRIYMQ